VTIKTIPEQLRERRTALGLSLCDVARRAGTSAAALSRYESGWSRFETRTLHKLATALDCDLEIRLRPREKLNRKSSVDDSDALAQLKRLFWDYPIEIADLRQRSVWVAERVLEYGNLNDVRTLLQTLGRRSFLAAVAAAERVSPRTRSFWCQMLEQEGIPCTKKYSRNTAWNS
jgi:transcriptional regulator with XRE-family HTH domain